MPQKLEAGQTYEKAYVLPNQSIFWTKSIKMDSEGNRYGCGTLSLELVLLDKIGFDLHKNPYALNETIRILIRTLTPFFVLITVSLLTPRNNKTMLDRFYVKMKTKVHPNPQEDARQMKLSYVNPNRFDDCKLFPQSDWEFDKWDKTDTIGFVCSVVVAILVMLFLMALLSMGK